MRTRPERLQEENTTKAMIKDQAPHSNIIPKKRPIPDLPTAKENNDTIRTKLRKRKRRKRSKPLSIKGWAGWLRKSEKRRLRQDDREKKIRGGPYQFFWWGCSRQLWIWTISKAWDDVVKMKKDDPHRVRGKWVDFTSSSQCVPCRIPKDRSVEVITSVPVGMLSTFYS